MTRPGQSSPPSVRCPICMCVFEWPDAYSDELDDMLYSRDEASDDWVRVKAEELEIYREADDDPRRLGFRGWLTNKYVKCPNLYKSDGEHFLSYRYGWYEDPLIVGMVGATTVGKSHLLAAMIGQLMHGVGDLGIQVSPIDPARHREYVNEFVNPLLSNSKVIEATREKADGDIVRFVDALRVSRASDGFGRTLAFYDVSGEDLAVGRRSTDFAKMAEGLIFVVDPKLSGLLGPGGRELSDEAFDRVLGLLDEAGRRDRRTGLYDVDVAVVINKSDVIRFEQAVRHWYRRPRIQGVVEVDQIMWESRDAYTLLHSRGAHAWLTPVEACRRATLHFASATGTERKDAEELRFELPVQPRRVLEPLISLLAMAGIIDEKLLRAKVTQGLGV